MNKLSCNNRQAINRIQPHDPQFDHAMQVQVVVPHMIFERQGIEMTPQRVMKLVNEVLLKMPRFANFRLGSHILLNPEGNARIVLENKNIFNLGRDCSVVTLVLPEEFVLPPVILELPEQ